MSRESITLSYKQLGAIALVLVNSHSGRARRLDAKTPLGAKPRNSGQKQKTQLDELQKQLNQLHVDLSGKYVTRQSFFRLPGANGRNHTTP